MQDLEERQFVYDLLEKRTPLDAESYKRANDILNTAAGPQIGDELIAKTYLRLKDIIDTRYQPD